MAVNDESFVVGRRVHPQVLEEGGEAIGVR